MVSFDEFLVSITSEVVEEAERGKVVYLYSKFTENNVSFRYHYLEERYNVVDRAIQKLYQSYVRENQIAS